MKTLYVVQTLIGDDHENVWTDTDESGRETPTTFTTRAAAAMAIAEHIRALLAAGMDASDGFKIVGVTA